MRRPVRVIATAAAVMFSLAACGGTSSSGGGGAGGGSGGGDCKAQHPGVKTVAKGALTVAAYQYPPFSDVTGELTGAEGEIIRKIAAMECLKLVVQKGAAASMIPAVQTGRADTTLGDWYRTKERAKVVRLGAPVLADQTTFISKSGVSTVGDLKGKKVGSVLGFLWNSDLQKLLGSGNVKLYQSPQAEYADLAAGRIDVIVDTYPSAVSTLKKTPIPGVKLKVPPPDPRVQATVHPGQSMFPVSKNNDQLGEALDADVAKLRASGELEKLIKPFGFKPSAAHPGKPSEL
jgi:polar amino acid transport system substrate-binding protein